MTKLNKKCKCGHIFERHIIGHYLHGKKAEFCTAELHKHSGNWVVCDCLDFEEGDKVEE